MNVTTLAQAMNVTTNDVLSLINMVSASLEQDGMKEIFLGMNEEDHTNTVQAYVAAEVKKFSEFCFSLLTNVDKKSAFDQYMFYKLKGEC